MRIEVERLSIHLDNLVLCTGMTALKKVRGLCVFRCTCVCVCVCVCVVCVCICLCVYHLSITQAIWGKHCSDFSERAFQMGNEMGCVCTLNISTSVDVIYILFLL